MRYLHPFQYSFTPFVFLSQVHSLYVLVCVQVRWVIILGLFYLVQEKKRHGSETNDSELLLNTYSQGFHNNVNINEYNYGASFVN